ncbi:MAG: DUF1311 domain-containing protein [Sphingobacteriales bacterium]|nr:MAG: DUF1311 domain-containing protein [Sphingobacteriales bacterium]
MQLLRFMSLFLLCFLPNFTSFAQNNSNSTEDPIETKLNTCMENNPSTMGVVQCLDTAYLEWDAELNKYYKLLQTVVSKDQKTSLRTVQLSWIEYRDKEFELLQKLYESKEGTMFIPMIVYDKVEIVKHRALELKSHYSLLTEY